MAAKKTQSKKPATKKSNKIATPAATFKKGMRVQLSNGTHGEIIMIKRDQSIEIMTDAGKKIKATRGSMQELKRGRKALLTSLSNKELHDEIKQIVGELKACADRDEKKRLRRALRRRGRTGGLGLRAKVVEAR